MTAMNDFCRGLTMFDMTLIISLYLIERKGNIKCCIIQRYDSQVSHWGNFTLFTPLLFRSASQFYFTFAATFNFLRTCEFVVSENLVAVVVTAFLHRPACRSQTRVTRCKHWNFPCSDTQGRSVNQPHGRFSDERRGRKRTFAWSICNDLTLKAEIKSIRR